MKVKLQVWTADKTPLEIVSNNVAAGMGIVITEVILFWIKKEGSTSKSYPITLEAEKNDIQMSTFIDTTDLKQQLTRSEDQHMLLFLEAYIIL